MFICVRKPFYWLAFTLSSLAVFAIAANCGSVWAEPLKRQILIADEAEAVVVQQGPHGGTKVSIKGHHVEIVIGLDDVTIFGADDENTSIFVQTALGVIESHQAKTPIVFSRTGPLTFAYQLQPSSSSDEQLTINVIFSDGHGMGWRMPLKRRVAI